MLAAHHHHGSFSVLQELFTCVVRTKRNYYIASKITQFQLSTDVISVLQNLTDARWWRNEATEMHVCKPSMGLEKPKFGK